jgi:hypothetical protein
MSRLKIDLGLKETEQPASINAFLISIPNAIDSGSLSNITISMLPLGTALRLKIKASFTVLLIVLAFVFSTSANTCFSNSSLHISAFFSSILAFSNSTIALVVDSLACSPTLNNSPASFSNLEARSFACPASLFDSADSIKEKGRQDTSPAIPKINSNSNFFFNFLRLHSAEGNIFGLFGISRFNAQSASPQSATNTAKLQKISSQPQIGIDEIKDMDLWIFQFVAVQYLSESGHFDSYCFINRKNKFPVGGELVAMLLTTEPA